MSVRLTSFNLVKWLKKIWDKFIRDGFIIEEYVVMKLFAGLLSFGLLVAGAGVAAETEAEVREAVVSVAKATHINGGINPTHKGVKLSLKVMTGSNPCHAEGVTVSTSQSRDHDTITVTAHIIDTSVQNRICTMEYNPQYQTVDEDIYFDSEDISDVLIKNYQYFGQSVSALELLP